jgi:antirestriction protein ArdC
MKADQLYQQITDRIIADLEAGVAGWSRPWITVGTTNPLSVSTGKRYNGINWLILSLEAMDRGYQSPWWATFNQWAKLMTPEGGETPQIVRKGEKATAVSIWKPRKRKPGDPESVKDSVYASTFNVFNAAQIVDPPERYAGTPPALTEPERIEGCEAFFDALGADLRVGGDRAFYAPAGDYIQIPPLAQFTEPEHYYSTLAHEHVHWTGHGSRLNRELRQRFGSEAYAFEELIAEIGAAFLSAQLGIDNVTRTDHSSYLASWLKVLRGNPKAIGTAASAASAAADFLNERVNTRELEPA